MPQKSEGLTGFQSAIGASPERTAIHPGSVSCIAAFSLVAACVLVNGPLHAAAAVDPNRWHDVKCVRYTKAWTAALAHQGPRGLGQAFLDSHTAFLDSNCARRADVCARSPEELRLANTMVILSMNAGTASTFPPFYCR